MPLSKAYKAPVLFDNEKSTEVNPYTTYIYGDIPVTPRTPRMIPHDLSTEFDLSSIPSKAPKKSLPYVTPERMNEQSLNYADSLRGFLAPTDIPDRDIPGLPYREISDQYNMTGLLPRKTQMLEEQSVATAKPGDIVTSPRILVKKDPTGQHLDLPGSIVVGQYAPDFKGEESDIPPDIKDPKALPENTLPDFKTFLQNLQNTSDTAAKSESAALDPLFKLMSRTAASTGVYRGEMPKPLLPQFIDDYKTAEKQKIDNELSRLKIQAQIDANKSLAAQRQFEAERKKAMLPYQQLETEAKAKFWAGQGEQKLFTLEQDKELADPNSERSNSIKTALDIIMQQRFDEMTRMGRDPTLLKPQWEQAKRNFNGIDAAKFVKDMGGDISSVIKVFGTEQQGTRQLNDLDWKTKEAELTRQHQAAMAAKKAEYEKELAKLKGTEQRKTIAAKPLKAALGVGGLTPAQEREIKEIRQSDKNIDTGAGIQDVFGQIESLLPFKFDDIDSKGNFSRNGKLLKASELLPGKAALGVGYLNNPINYINNPEFTTFKAAVSKLMNVELKDRSGAAVSVPEFERFKNEWSANSWNSKEEFLRSLKAAVNGVDRAMERNLAEYSNDTLKILGQDRQVSYFRPNYRYKSPRLQQNFVGVKQASQPAATVTTPAKKGLTFRKKTTGERFTIPLEDTAKINRFKNSTLFEEVK